MRYADLFAPRKPFYGIFIGTCFLSRHASYSEAVNSVWMTTTAYAGERRIVCIEPALDGNMLITPPVPGGTWGGECGSTIWRTESVFLIDQERKFDQYRADLLRAWWRNSRAQGWEPGPLPGYRVECERGHHHLGPCGLDREGTVEVHLDWNGYESIQYEPMVLDLIPG